MTQAKQDHGRTPPPSSIMPQEAKLADYYRQKAEECRRFAEATSDAFSRDEWLRMANGWTQLALHSDR